MTRMHLPKIDALAESMKKYTSNAYWRGFFAFGEKIARKWNAYDDGLLAKAWGTGWDDAKAEADGRSQ